MLPDLNQDLDLSLLKSKICNIRLIYTFLLYIKIIPVVSQLCQCLKIDTYPDLDRDHRKFLPEIVCKTV